MDRKRVFKVVNHEGEPFFVVADSFIQAYQKFRSWQNAESDDDFEDPHSIKDAGYLVDPGFIDKGAPKSATGREALEAAVGALKQPHAEFVMPKNQIQRLAAFMELSQEFTRPDCPDIVDNDVELCLTCCWCDKPATGTITLMDVTHLRCDVHANETDGTELNGRH